MLEKADMMADSYFRPGDKARDFSRLTILYSSLTVLFSIYSIKLSDITVFNLKLDPSSESALLKDVNISVIIYILSTYYFVQLAVNYATQYVDDRSLSEFKTLEAVLETLEKPIQIVGSDAQQAFNKVQGRMRALSRANSFIAVFRLLSDVIAPILFFGVATYRELAHTYYFMVIAFHHH